MKHIILAKESRKPTKYRNKAICLQWNFNNRLSINAQTSYLHKIIEFKILIAVKIIKIIIIVQVLTSRCS